ncbi:MAG: tetratricopeptide repeat protein [Rhizobiales bacterium]|nr:tetratricopeptide repeat protein [Hyphomicrobiales bacterium]
MIRVLLAAVCMVVLAASSLQAGGLDHLKAAKTAAEAGNADEAIHLFTQAISAGDLSAADKLVARKGRGSIYTGKSMIADAFQKRDDARRLRDNAIEDLTAAIRSKTDDDELYMARAQALHMNGQYDKAVADLDAALKLKDSLSTLMQRAASNRAKGDYDRAVADFTAAATRDPKSADLDGWEAYNERGYTLFLAARYAEAAADFDKVLSLGVSSHSGDVLWLPYQTAWLHIARARAGQNDAEELARYAGKIDLKQWPGTLVAFFLGQIKADQLSSPSSHGASMGRARECNLSFFTGEHALVKGDKAEAARLFVRVREVCSIHTVHFLAAGVELKRLGK